MTAGTSWTCSSTRGTAVDPVYLQALFAQALAAEAIAAQEAGRYQDALDRYTDALRLPGGDQLRVLNGVYLANWALGRREEAEAAFARAVDHGLAQDRLAVKLLFRPGSTAFWPDPAVSGPYPMWLRQIASSAFEAPAMPVSSTASASPRIHRRQTGLMLLAAEAFGRNRSFFLQQRVNTACADNGQ